MRLVLIGLFGLVVGGVAGAVLAERIRDPVWRVVMRLNYGKAPK